MHIHIDKLSEAGGILGKLGFIIDQEASCTNSSYKNGINTDMAIEMLGGKV